MQINNPWMIILFLTIPPLCWLNSKTKHASIVISNIQFVKKTNSRLDYIHRDWLFMIRIFELSFLIFSMSDIHILSYNISYHTAIAATILFIVEIFLKNIFMRTLP